MRPGMISGMIQRTDDIGYIKHQQDAKPAIQQQNVQTQMVKKEDNLRHQVMDTEHNNKSDTHADAREEGKGTYFLRKKHKEKKEETEDRVVQKGQTSRFDIKI